MKTATMVWIVLIVLVVVGLGWYFWSGNSSATPSGQTVSLANQGGQDANTPSAPAPTVSSPSVPTSATVTYDGSTFSPASITILRGGTVTFTDTAGQMWIASNPHPVHTGYDGTTMSQHCAAGYAGPAPLDECAPGASFTFTFDKVGTWGYHDHLNHGAGGTIIVQ